MIEAKHYEILKEKKLKCRLCPHECTISDGKRGICGVRLNQGGTLYSENYELASSVAIDPIEKKPLYHFYPGEQILSIGSVGCNLKCKFCQNWEISQSCATDFKHLRKYSASELIYSAKAARENIGIAYTYNEPTIWFEYMLDIGKRAKEQNLKNIVVTNGYINPSALDELLPYMDAFNVDLKAFRDKFYKEQTQSRLQPVLNSIKKISDSGKHLELTHLIIPSLNDKLSVFKEMIDWIVSEVGEKTVLHLSRYFPRHQMDIANTPSDTLYKFYDLAREKLAYVYIGNHYSNKGQNTYCPECGQLVILRNGYSTVVQGLTKDGRCSSCQHKILDHI